MRKTLLKVRLYSSLTGPPDIIRYKSPMCTPTHNTFKENNQVFPQREESPEIFPEVKRYTRVKTKKHHFCKTRENSNAVRTLRMISSRRETERRSTAPAGWGRRPPEPFLPKTNAEVESTEVIARYYSSYRFHTPKVCEHLTITPMCSSWKSHLDLIQPLWLWCTPFFCEGFPLNVGAWLCRIFKFLHFNLNTRWSWLCAQGLCCAGDSFCQKSGWKGKVMKRDHSAWWSQIAMASRNHNHV